ncbi:MAG: PHP domain-containing protein [Clostridia bacterium]|nr:PHP domain-containing protein [Clostridia bacterium]
MHTHSVYSDGTFTPKEIVDAAISKGLSAVALTDHNTVDGLTELVAAANRKTTEASLMIAEELKLLMSGGSDFHGARKPDIDLGIGKGDLRIPYEWFIELKNHI